MILNRPRKRYGTSPAARFFRKYRPPGSPGVRAAVPVAPASRAGPLARAGSARHFADPHAGSTPTPGWCLRCLKSAHRRRRISAWIVRVRHEDQGTRWIYRLPVPSPAHCTSRDSGLPAARSGSVTRHQAWLRDSAPIRARIRATTCSRSSGTSPRGGTRGAPAGAASPRSYNRRQNAGISRAPLKSPRW